MLKSTSNVTFAVPTPDSIWATRAWLVRSLLARADCDSFYSQSMASLKKDQRVDYL